MNIAKPGLLTARLILLTVNGRIKFHVVSVASHVKIDMFHHFHNPMNTVFANCLFEQLFLTNFDNLAI